MNYNEQLDSLFDEWIELSKKHQETRETAGDRKIVFTKDGLMEKNDSTIDICNSWNQSTKRVMFLVKDQPTIWCDDARLWLKNGAKDDCETLNRKQQNRELKPRFIRNIANVFWGLMSASREHPCTATEMRESFDLIKANFNQLPFAFVECKKQGGTTSISNNILQRYLNTYGDLLWREIQILRPNILVCTSRIIYTFIIGKYPQNELLLIPEHNSIRIHPQTKTIILCSYHPSARISFEKFYEGVLEHYRAYINSDYYKL